jgi:hypothetical protein
MREMGGNLKKHGGNIIRERMWIHTCRYIGLGHPGSDTIHGHMTIIGKPSFVPILHTAMHMSKSLGSHVLCTWGSNSLVRHCNVYFSYFKQVGYVPVQKFYKNRKKFVYLCCAVQWFEGKINILFYSILFYSS